MKAAVFGYGTVGKGIEKLLARDPHLEIKYIFVRKEKEKLPYLTNDLEGIISDPEIRIVFECLSGTDPADTVIRKALENGKHVISANKMVLAQHLREYTDIAGKHHGTLQIEASVAAAIPFIDALLKVRRFEEVRGFEGILNGTTNFMLNRMFDDGLSYAEALQEAQDLGYAERDPSSDVGGYDAMYKAILASQLAYRAVHAEAYREGIEALRPEDIAFAKTNHKRLKLLVSSFSKNDAYAAVVSPCFLPEESYLANTPQKLNAQLLYADSFGTLGYYGPGAGQTETAQAMIQDAYDVIEERIRPIVLDRELHFDPGLIRSDWICRTSLPLEEEKLEEGLYLLKDRSLSIFETFEKLRKKDPQLMFARWK